MKPNYSLFQSHLDYTKHYWKILLTPNDHVIDCTCGNGHDSLFLAKLIPSGHLYCFDIQPQAIDNSKTLFENTFKKIPSHVTFLLQSHDCFPTSIPLNSIKLIVYNLGYLPGGDKTITTQTPITLKSIQQALLLLCPGGTICITCYSGHQEGEMEEKVLQNFLANLCPKQFLYSHTFFCNRNKSPSVILVQKALL